MIFIRDFIAKMKRFALRRYMTFFVPAIFFVVFFSLYLMMESVNLYSDDASNSQTGANVDIETKLRQIEDDIKTNRKMLDQIKDVIHDISKSNDNKKLKRILEIADNNNQEGKKIIVKSDNSSDNRLVWKRSKVRIPGETCKLAESVPPESDVQMLDVLSRLPFDNPDGGVWKQGFPISYEPDLWKAEKLKVFVVPHSHNDPGWLKTFEAYYDEQTRHILDNMVQKLDEHPKMRFVYAEMSFFSRWWNEIDTDKKEKVKQLLKENRLEIVSGGWVMTDEANAHYFAMLDQMIEGNQWLWNEVGVKPVSSWSIDPFGHSPTMPYLLRELGFKNMLIQRVHYAVKKYLAERVQLEFHWRQVWDRSGATNMFCHMMPFYSYDIPHTCGPNPKTCCEFDFKRLVGGKFKCPWHNAPVPIDDGTVEDRAETLLDQYRQKSRLYKHNVLLIPLGDDFRYDTMEEWDLQYVNYQRLFDFINGKTEWNTEIRFATLTDYFDALRERAGGSDDGISPAGYPVLSGDFFTYSDREDDYWSGYFTSRPFYKGLDRVLESHQRGGEIIFSLALATARRLDVKTFPVNELFAKLVSARRCLGLFQHHDGITGTAKDLVVADYGAKLLQSIQDMKKILTDSAQFLLTIDKNKYNPDVTVFDVDETRESHDSLPEKTVIRLKDLKQMVAFYNSLSRNRTCLVTLLVDSPHLEVRDCNDSVVKTQVSPFWTTNDEMSEYIYRVSFFVGVPALGLIRYSIIATKPNSNPSNVFAKVEIFNSLQDETSQEGPFNVEKKKSSSNIFLETMMMKLLFSEDTGMLKEVLLKDFGDSIATNIAFFLYGVRGGKDRSGAYLFLPDGTARQLQYDSNPIMRKIEGSLMSEMRVSIYLVDHTIRIANSLGLDGSSIEIKNLVDIRSEGNTELAMRIMTDIENVNDEFFTDLNGFQVLRRKTLKTLPLNANFYPMSTTAFLENKKHRLNVLTAQSLGVSSLKTGWLEIMQDRRLDQDDHRGLNQPVHDNKVTPNVFRLLIEKRESVDSLANQPAGYPSLRSHLVSQELLHPVHVLPAAQSSARTSHQDDLLSELQPLRTDLPCDVHLVNLRTLQRSEDGASARPADETGLILHRLGVDCGIPTTGAFCHFTDGQISLSSLFSVLHITEAYSSALNLVERQSLLNVSSAVQIPSMEIRSYKIKLR